MYVRCFKSLDKKCFVINTVTGIYVTIICKHLKAVESEELIREKSGSKGANKIRICRRSGNDFQLDEQEHFPVRAKRF